MTGLALAVGQVIELNDGRRAIIRFLGPTGFAPGEWIGVELEEGSGKNDGSVKGDRYFECENNYGMFLRAAGVGKIVEQAKNQAGPPSRTAQHGAGGAKSRPSSISSAVGRGPGVDARRRESAVLSPSRSPTKQLGAAAPITATPRRPLSTASTAGASNLRSRPSLASTPSMANKRTSTVPASATPRNTSRPSVTGQTVSSRAPARPGAARQSLAPPQRPQPSRLSSVSSNHSDARTSHGSQQSPLLGAVEDEGTPDAPATPTEDHRRDEDNEQQVEDQTQHHTTMHPPPRPMPAAPAQAQTSTSMRPPPRRTSSPPASSQRNARPSAVSTRELEDMQAKMRVLERKRLEDRERLKKMAEVEQERDKYASVMQKLQTKMQSQSQELAELRKQLKESETSLLDIEAIQAEHDAVVEMATLDREMAEETAEVLKTEVEALRSKNEEMNLELEILREENQELGREMSPDERTGQGWLQMERSNERLREALMRLRDITQEQEAELKDQIKALEDEVHDFAGVKQDHEEMKEKLLATEADLDDLRQQLEAALGAEDMIEELTERNLSLQEQIEELTATVEDLESLRELNDELEINHVESEKQMQEEIDFKDSLIGENTRRSAQQQQTIEDCEYTISRFRDLVTNLQTDLEEMRASQQITDKEAADLSSRSRAMLDLNMKLQISASKTQVKTIDLELRRLDAEEAAEHLAIVQLFLPEAFHSERDSVLALLRFKRVGFKARLVHTFVKDRLTNQAVNVSDESLFAACSVMDRLSWITAMSQRFTNSICACSVDDFAKYEGALYELEPVERALNNYIEALKRDDINESTMDEELQRSMAVMSHLASLHIRDSSATLTDDVLMQSSLVQSHLETAASAFTLCKSFVQASVPEASHEDDDEESSEPTLIEKLDAFVSHTRGAKVIAGKTHRALADLQSRSLALEPSKLEVFVNAEQVALKLAYFTRSAGEALQRLFGEEGREEPFTLSEVNLVLSRLSSSTFNLATPESSTMAAVATSLRSLTDQLTKLAALAADLDNTTEFERLPAPWVTRSAEFRATKLTSVDTEAEVARLTEIVRDRSLLVRSKEQELEEQGVRIEMLEARMAEAQKRSAQFGDLETRIRTSQETEKTLRGELSEAQKDTKRIRQERDELRRQAAQHQVDAKDAYAPNVDVGRGASRVELDRAKAQEKNLKAAVRYLQSRSAPNAAKPISDLDWLEEPLFKVSEPLRQELGLLEAEAKSACTELLNVAINSKPVKISSLSAKSRLAWRPAQETTAWATQRQREEWETWREWQDDILSRAKSVDFRMSTAPKKYSSIGGADGVVIVGEA